jgi:hypothetical protein
MNFVAPGSVMIFLNKQEKAKSKFTLEQAMNAKRGSGGVAQHFL